MSRSTSILLLAACLAVVFGLSVSQVKAQASLTNDPAAGSAEAIPAGLVVYPAEPSAHPIPRYITGKFCEHLFYNITQGMDAQILMNPTLSEYPFRDGQMSPDGIVMFLSDRREIIRRIRGSAPRWGWPAAQIDGLVDSWNNALACWWTRIGAVRTSADVGPDGQRAQRIAITAPGQGIAQWTWLPLHRIRDYEFELWARSPEIQRMSVVLSDPTGETICSRVDLTGLSTQWRKFQGRLTVPADLPADQAYRFAVLADQSGDLLLERILLYPADHINRADPDVVRFLRESHLPLLRWPGGNFVSGYHWRDGVGPLQQRPTLPNYAWGEQENNLFGTDEFVAFCRAVGCDPLICVNAGSGTPQEAADWIEYCNGSVDTPMGKLRAQNGHPEPYGIRYWEVGNELWGDWQYYWTTAEGYADRYRQFARSMLAADPRITLYACGAPVFWGDHWNNTLIGRTADILQRTTDHPLIGGDVGAETDPLDVYRDFMAVPDVLERKWSDLEAAMKKAGIDNPRLAVTELQLFAHRAQTAAGGQRRLTRENLVNPATHAEALYDILIYHAAVRLAPFVEMVTQSATVNHGGGLRKQRQQVWANPCHYAQTMFSVFGGARPVRTDLDCPRRAAPLVLPDLKRVTSSQDYRLLDALAAVSPDGRLLISVVHKGTDQPVDLTVQILGRQGAGTVRVLRLAADVPWRENTLEDPRLIAPQESSVPCRDGTLSLRIAPYTYACLELPG
ncbi:MAG: hypothetical protein JW810_06170 [Sedimentisphaerales bacterium]|nr:hypothetical protein [Sedimentisphaerales bacterium]